MFFPCQTWSFSWKGELCVLMWPLVIFVARGRPSSTAKCGISSRQCLCSLRVAMVFHMPRAVFLLVLVVVLCSWPMRRVFVGHGVAQRWWQRTRIQSVSLKHYGHDGHDYYASDVEERPMIDGKPLDVGALVGYELKPTRFTHTAIYAGRGDSRLRDVTGVEDLKEFKHYVIEFGCLNRTSRSLWSQLWEVMKGKGKQCICITEMESSCTWCRYELNYLDPMPSAGTMISRAAGYVGSQFGRGYDPCRNNCQHFAVWCRYGKKELFPGAWEEKLRAAWRSLASWAAFAAAAWARNVPLTVAVAALCLGKLLTAKTRKMTQNSITFRPLLNASFHYRLSACCLPVDVDALSYVTAPVILGLGLRRGKLGWPEKKWKR